MDGIYEGMVYYHNTRMHDYWRVLGLEPGEISEGAVHSQGQATQNEATAAVAQWAHQDGLICLFHSIFLTIDRK